MLSLIIVTVYILAVLLIFGVVAELFDQIKEKEKKLSDKLTRDEINQRLDKIYQLELDLENTTKEKNQN